MQKKMYKKIRNNLGMSLVSVMISAAIMGGIGMVMMQYIDNANKHAKYIKAKAELDVEHNGLLALLKNATRCQEIFTQATFGVEYVINADTTGGFARLIPKDEKAKIKLVKIIIYRPDINPDLLPSKAPRPIPTISENGWLTTVAFHYEMYKPVINADQTEGKNLMAGSYDQVKYATMTFDNFNLNPTLINGGEANCQSSGDIIKVYREGDVYSFSGTCVKPNGDLADCKDNDVFNQSSSEYGFCYNGSLGNPIQKCSL